jgi:hypothetical protein
VADAAEAPLLETVETTSAALTTTPILALLETDDNAGATPVSEALTASMVVKIVMVTVSTSTAALAAELTVDEDAATTEEGWLFFREVLLDLAEEEGWAVEDEETDEIFDTVLVGPLGEPVMYWTATASWKTESRS